MYMWICFGYEFTVVPTVVSYTQWLFCARLGRKVTARYSSLERPLLYVLECVLEVLLLLR